MEAAQLQFDPVVIQAAEGIAAQHLTIVEQATALTIADPESAALAGSLLATIRTRRKAIAEAFAPMKKSAHDAHRHACDLEKRADERWAAAEADVKKEIGRWDEHCEAERREQERLAAIERRRQEDEQRRLAELERVRLQKESDEQTLAVAAIAESVGDTEGAARILEHAPTIRTPDPEPVMPTPIAVAPQAKVPGASVRKVWRHRIVNRNAIKREYLEPNASAIAQVVKALGPDAVNAVGGIEVYEERQVAGRSR